MNKQIKDLKQRIDQQEDTLKTLLEYKKMFLEILVDFEFEVRNKMNKEQIIERLATLEHKRWVLWTENILQTELLTNKRLEEWKRLQVPYNQLTEEQKEYSRAWAEQIIKAMSKHGTALTDPTII